jgi:hypothetical protein
VIGQSHFHRRRYSQRLVDAAEIVVCEVNRNPAAVILKFLREGIGLRRESAKAHPPA